MRAKLRKHELGEDFVIDKFALLPICIKGELRWLERVKIEAHYYRGLFGVDVSYHHFID